MIFKKRIFILLICALVLFTIPGFAKNQPVIDAEYNVHVEDIGWMGFIPSDEIAGTTGQNKQIEAIQIDADLSSDSSIEYQSHVSDIGWEENWSKDGETSGTEGENKKLQAIRIKLTGTDANLYDIYYRTHVSDAGWLGWAKNGEDAGSTGLDRKMEAIQIIVLSKDDPAPGSTEKALVTKDMDPITSANVHVSDIGWIASSLDKTLGTTGQGKKIEALSLTYGDEGQSGIEYTSHLQDIGWENSWHSDGDVTGTTGQNRRLEAIKINLTGYAASKYDIYYQAHCSNVGWLGWAKNGEAAGTEGRGEQIEALNIKIVSKNSAAPGITKGACLTTSISQEAFVARVKGCWLNNERSNDPTKSYIIGIADNYISAGYNQTYNGIEGYYSIMAPETTGGKVVVADQETGKDIELYISYEDLPENQIKVISSDGTERTLTIGDTTDGVHYTFSGLKQYGQLAVVELKSGPSN